MMTARRQPSRAEFDRLKKESEHLRNDIDALRNRVQEQANEIRTQFVRIAEMQAVLDEERMANGRPRHPRPLFPAHE